MHAHEHVLAAVDLALDERDVWLAGQRLAEGDRGELAVRGREPHLRDALDELLRPASVLDQIGDRQQLDPVLLAERGQVRDAGHRPVLVHDLADDARRVQPREPSEVDGRLRLAGALEHAAGPRAKRKDVAGPDEVVRALRRVDRDLDRVRAVVRRDAGRDALARLDRDGEGGAERRLVLARHLLEAELVAALLGQAEADQAARVRRHEVDRLRASRTARRSSGRPRSRGPRRRRRRRSGPGGCPRSPLRRSRTARASQPCCHGCIVTTRCRRSWGAG